MVYAESWKSGIVIFGQHQDKVALLSDEGRVEEERKFQDNKVNCYHGLCALSQKGSLIVCDDSYKVYKFPYI